nr:DUF493 family protein [uncultured Holophaga sp.]
MESCPRPQIDYPTRVPLKVVGLAEGLDPAAVAGLIAELLPPQPQGDRVPESRRNGKYISYTFWITLEAEGQELPLRKALTGLSGYVMQL